MNKSKNHSIDVVFVLVLFCTFAVSVLMVLMVGAESYNDVTDSMVDNYTERTGVGYIAEKIRHFDTADGIETGTFDNQNALIIYKNIDGSMYATYIYCYDGYIRELFTETDNKLSADAGEEIIAAAGFKAETVSEDLIKVTCIMDDGSEPYIILHPRCGERNTDEQA
jgi:hypothetical protein